MSRAWPAGLVVLALSLVAFAVVADRALVARTEGERERAREGAAEAARLAAAAVRAELAALEQAVVEGKAPEGVETWSLPLPPRIRPRTGDPHGRRSRTELRQLLTSDGATASGLPEAVVAAIALGDPSARRRAGERLLEGELPVTPGDLPHLAAVLGLANDPRTAVLVERLHEAPAPSRLPSVPAFRRRLLHGDRLEGWTRTPGRLLRYAVDVGELVARAGVGTSVERVDDGVVSNATGEPSARSSEAAVPGVPEVRFRGELPPQHGLRLAAPRLGLWLLTAALLASLAAWTRALQQQRHAVERELAFVAAVTHELRSPLASIRLLGQTLAAGRGEPAEYGRLVAAESERLARLVEQVLTAARAEEAPHLAPTDVGELVAEAVALVSVRARSRGVEILERVDRDLPPPRWDADAVRRALVNLLDNAVRHGPGDASVVVTAARTESGERAQETLRLSVTDEGAGPRARERRRVFGRFVRGREATSGTGLGLWLVERVARAHRGRVDLDASTDGCTFSLVLPVDPRPQEEASPERDLRSATT